MLRPLLAAQSGSPQARAASDTRAAPFTRPSHRFAPPHGNHPRAAASASAIPSRPASPAPEHANALRVLVRRRRAPHERRRAISDGTAAGCRCLGERARRTLRRARSLRHRADALDAHAAPLPAARPPLLLTCSREALDRRVIAVEHASTSGVSVCLRRASRREPGNDVAAVPVALGAHVCWRMRQPVAAIRAGLLREKTVTSSMPPRPSVRCATIGETTADNRGARHYSPSRRAVPARSTLEREEHRERDDQRDE